jgi:hypothetical protein
MNMCADLLSSFGRSKDSYDRDLGFFIGLRGLDIVSEEGIEWSWSRLIIINTVQPDAEEVHGLSVLLIRRAH